MSRRYALFCLVLLRLVRPHILDCPDMPSVLLFDLFPVLNCDFLGTCAVCLRLGLSFSLISSICYMLSCFRSVPWFAIYLLHQVEL